MIAWRRRSDGFEWHKHVRTTVLLRRADRRRRIEGARVAAVDGLKGAGRASVEAGSSGLTLALEWARALATAMLAGIHAGFVWLIEAIPPAWARFCAILRRLGASILAGLTTVCAPIRSSGRQAFLFVAGLISAGMSALLAWFSGRLGALPLPRSLPSIDTARVASVAVAVVITASVVVGGSWLLWRGSIYLANASGLAGLFAQTIEGRATAITGDAFRIGDTEIRLAGIEAPDSDQLCSRPGNRRWRCGVDARAALARSVRGTEVSCTLSGTDASGRKLGTCVARGEDIAEGLVRQGHVFAETGMFSKYASQEEEARAEKAGLWRGEAERPSEYRAKVAERMARAWEKAVRTAPGGCPIKGRIASGRKLYALPGTVDYPRIRIRPRRGERWFCSEEEALAAGWKRSPRS